MQTDFASSGSRISLRDVAVAKLRALAAGMRLTPEGLARAIEVFDLLSDPWSAAAVGDNPPWPNDITDDGTPFEFSVALQRDEVELRMLLESQLPVATPTSTWEAGLLVQSRLVERGLASLERFQQVADLFSPASSSRARFSLWHAAVLREGVAPLLKVYLNPQVHGADLASQTVREALRRLGLLPAREFLSERVARFARSSDIAYFSLDLCDDELSRVKVYVGTSGSASTVEALLEGAANFAPGDATRWLRALTGRVGPYDNRPILTCFSFVQNQASPQATLHVPVRSYVRSDAQAARRLFSLLDVDARVTLERVVSAVSERPLDAGRGLITYASLRPTSEGPRVTAYLAPQTYAITAPRPGRDESTPPPCAQW